MSLIPCPECQATISDQAPACPRCGYPLTPQDPRLLSEKNVGQIVSVTGLWLTVPWVVKLIFGIVAVVTLATVLILK